MPDGTQRVHTVYPSIDHSEFISTKFEWPLGRAGMTIVSESERKQLSTSQSIPGNDLVELVRLTQSGLKKENPIFSEGQQTRDHDGIYPVGDVVANITQNVEELPEQGNTTSSVNTTSVDVLQSDGSPEQQEVKTCHDVETNASSGEKKSQILMFKWGSKDKRFRCQICDMSFETGDAFKAHMNKHDRNEGIAKPFTCHICLKSFTNAKTLAQHAKVHSGIPIRRCKFCHKVFANKENLNKHIQTHMDLISCPFCDEKFAYKSSLNIHLAVHVKNNFSCELCDKTFNRKDILKRHMQLHDKDSRKKFKCVECNKHYSHMFVLKRHMRSMHSNEPDGRNCEVCGKFIRNKENLARHMKIHNNERDHICEKCGYSFTQKQHLKDHMNTHSLERKFKCNDCGLEFKHKRTLNRHLTKHKAVHKRTIIPCEYCEGRFDDKAALKRHMQSDHDTIYHCLICQKYFPENKRLSHLEEHEKNGQKTNGKRAFKAYLNKATSTEPVQGVSYTVVKGIKNIESGEKQKHSNLLHFKNFSYTLSSSQNLDQNRRIKSEPDDAFVKASSTRTGDISENDVETDVAESCSKVNPTAEDQLKAACVDTLSPIKLAFHEDGFLSDKQTNTSGDSELIYFVYNGDNDGMVNTADSRSLDLNDLVENTSYPKTPMPVNTRSTSGRNFSSQSDSVLNTDNSVAQFVDGTQTESVHKSYISEPKGYANVPKDAYIVQREGRNQNENILNQSDEKNTKEIQLTPNEESDLKDNVRAVVEPKEEQTFVINIPDEECADHETNRSLLLQTLIDYAESIKDNPLSGEDNS